MLCLRKEIGSYEGRDGCFVCVDQHFGRASRHVYGNSEFGSHLLGCGHILVSRTKNLIYLRDRFGSKGERSNGLRTSYFDYFGNSNHLGSIENGWVNCSIPVGRGAEHNFLASRELGRHTEHQHGTE
jgi:hypothetical protein